MNNSILILLNGESELMILKSKPCSRIVITPKCIYLINLLSYLREIIDEVFFLDGKRTYQEVIPPGSSDVLVIIMAK